jgi:DNA-3-methyladenine glycosylase I
MANSGIIRNKLKIEATIKNARAFIEVINQYGTFDAYIWELTGCKPIVNHFSQLKGGPAKTELSDKMSKELSKKGFKFVGSTICYAYMQAAGFVNDHLATCFRHSEIQKLY